MAKSKGRREKKRTLNWGTAATAEQIAATRTSRADLAAEYAYVLTDLRRIGIIAVALIGVLVALSFFL